MSAAEFWGLKVFKIDYRAFFYVREGLIMMSGLGFKLYNLMDNILELCYGLRVVGDPSSLSIICLICSYSNELVT